MSARRLVLGFASLAGAAALGCGNPAVDQKIALYGDELPGVEPSQYHRPGQPCVVCHSEAGGASPMLAVGGTVFATPTGSMIPVEGAKVTLTDALGDARTATTNCIGNFFVKRDDWNPSFPLHAEVDYTLPGTQTEKVVSMASRISRDGSCAGCHLDPLPTGTSAFPQPRSEASPGPVFCVEAQPSPPFKLADGCPGKLPAQ